MDFLSLKVVLLALLAGIPMALCAALLGVSLVLKRYSMIGDGLSHVGFGALAVAYALNWAPMAVSIPVVLLAAFLLLRLSDSSRIKGDAAIALISGSALAVGVIIISVTKGMNTDITHYMFGSILSVTTGDMILSLCVAVAVLVLYVVFYNRLFAVTFDESFARATGTNTELYNTLLALLTAMVIVIGLRLMGALLISSLLIFPALTAMRVFRSFKSVVVCAGILSVICFFIGLYISSLPMNVPAGAGIVVVNLAAFGVFAGVGALRRRHGISGE